MNILDFLAKMPPEAFSAFGKLLTALLAGDPAKAAQQARITAETIAIKQSTRATVKAAKGIKK